MSATITQQETKAILEIVAERDLWKAEAERWRAIKIQDRGLHGKIAEMRGRMNGTYGAGRGWEAALDEMEEFLK